MFWNNRKGNIKIKIKQTGWLDAENARITLFTDGVACPAEESAVILLFILVDSMCDITLPSGCRNRAVGHFGH